jgi:hypothetical protein
MIILQVPQRFGGTDASNANRKNTITYRILPLYCTHYAAAQKIDAILTQRDLLVETETLTFTDLPTLTALPSNASLAANGSSTATPTAPSLLGSCFKILSVKDITIPDKTQLAPEISYKKPRILQTAALANSRPTRKTYSHLARLWAAVYNIQHRSPSRRGHQCFFNLEGSRQPHHLSRQLALAIGRRHTLRAKKQRRRFVLGGDRCYRDSDIFWFSNSDHLGNASDADTNQNADAHFFRRYRFAYNCKCF